MLHFARLVVVIVSHSLLCTAFCFVFIVFHTNIYEIELSISAGFADTYYERIKCAAHLCVQSMLFFLVALWLEKIAREGDRKTARERERKKEIPSMKSECLRLIENNIEEFNAHTTLALIIIFEYTHITRID